MSRFNLSEWALEHTQFVVFFMLLAVAMGILSYKRLGRSEDPSFTIRCMIISSYWPGASARMVEDQVTDKIEKKLQETRGLDYLQSFTRAGVSVIYVYLKDEVLAADIRPTWTQVRNSVGDIRATLPRGVVGPFFNDRFDDTFGSIYALTADGFTTAELKEYADKVRLKIMTVPDVAKADFLGVQSEVIFVEIENSRLATLGLEPDTVIKALQAQSIIAPAGMVDTATDNIYLRVSGMFQSVEQIRGTGIEANNRILRLGDIARIRRAYSEPSDPKMYFNGQPAIGLAISMTDGGNVLDLGENLNALMAQLKKELPAGIDIHQVSDQPKVVEESIGEFMEALIEAVIIVLAVSFVSLGVRAGIVVALAIPLVLCTVFTCMELLGIDLHKISLGALIIALGLLVDDAIISVEMMALKLEQGWDRVKAAGYAFTATSFPMLTGTLITAAGFIPVGFSKGGASEYAGAIFSVVGIALLVSWVVAVTVTPLLGHAILKEDRSAAIGGTEHEIADTKFTTVFRATLVWCLRNRRTVVGATLATFAAAVAINPLVPKEFFPASPRPELIVDMRLPEGSSLSATDREVRKFNELIRKD
ncbi:MAG TPA: efflux RND transporter permease subunit, partial [Spirochaetota bacterium]|nr:efflux RND transporter permease subunit [Spirochaetota bacterium]